MWAGDIISMLDVRSALAGAPSVLTHEAACIFKQVSVHCEGLHVNPTCEAHQPP